LQIKKVNSNDNTSPTFKSKDQKQTGPT